jgi:hypothetical protein
VSERASEPCWRDHGAGASDASFFQVASCARRGNISSGRRLPKHPRCHKRVPSGERHTGVRWYQYLKPYGDGQLRSVPQSAPPLPLPPSPPSRKRQTRHSGSRSAPLLFISTPSPPAADCRLDTCKDGTSSTCEGRFRAAISLCRTGQWKLPMLVGAEIISL